MEHHSNIVPWQLVCEQTGAVLKVIPVQDHGELDMAAFKAANNTAGVLFHYPAGQVNRTVEGTAALIEGRTDNLLAVIAGPPPRN